MMAAFRKAIFLGRSPVGAVSLAIDSTGGGRRQCLHASAMGILQPPLLRPQTGKRSPRCPNGAGHLQLADFGCAVPEAGLG